MPDTGLDLDLFGSDKSRNLNHPLLQSAEDELRSRAAWDVQ